MKTTNFFLAFLIFFEISTINCINGGGIVAKSCPTLETPGTVAGQVPLSMGSPRQEYWSGLPFPFPGALHDPEIELQSPAGRYITPEPFREAP